MLAGIGGNWRGKMTHWQRPNLPARTRSKNFWNRIENGKNDLPLRVSVYEMSSVKPAFFSRAARTPQCDLTDWRTKGCYEKSRRWRLDKSRASHLWMNLWVAQGSAAKNVEKPIC
jgi:hypothetical protein